jgi:hypothetical protein
MVSPAAVACRHRTIQAARLARLTDDDDGKAAHAFGHPFGFLAALDVLRFELGALLLKAGAVVLVGAKRLLLRQEEVSGVARLHLHHISHLSQLVDALEQDQFNSGHATGSSEREN